MPTIQGCEITRPTSRFLPGNCPATAPVRTTGQVAASSTGSIPIGATSYSLFVSGANGTVDGQSSPTGTSLSGYEPTGIATAIALVTGTATTITYTYIK